MTRKTASLIFRGLLFAVLLNWPNITAYRLSDPFSSINDLDEIVYLRAAIDQGNFLPHEAIYFEHAKKLSLSELLTNWRPDQTFSHFLVGWLANSAGLGILELNLVLDLIFAAACYLLFARFFAAIIDIDGHFAEVLAAILLSWPWLSAIENFYKMHSFFPRFTAQLPRISSSALPVQEGLEAQLSVFWMAICLLTWTYVRKSYKKRTWMLGVVCGLSIYIYALEWLVLTIMLPLFCVFDLFFIKSSKGSYQVVKSVITFLFFDLLAALAGLSIIQAIKAEKYIFIDSPKIYRNAFYLPVEWILILIGVIGVLWFVRERLSVPARVLLSLIAATILTEVIVLNVQPITGVATVGVFIVGTFTRPLLTALLVALMFVKFTSFKGDNRILRLSLWIVLLAVYLQASLLFNLNRKNNVELNSLVAAIDEKVPKGSVLTMLTFDPPFKSSTREWDWRWEPNGIAAVTGNYLLKESLSLEWGALTPTENISRELALATVYTGAPKLIRACTEDVRIEPRSMFFQQWIAIQLSRIHSCKETETIIRNLSPCDAIKQYRFDYVIWERDLLAEKPSYMDEAAESIWKSLSGTYELLKVDQEKAAALLCTE